MTGGRRLRIVRHDHWHPQNQAGLIAWLEEAVAGWNAAPTPFVWDGKRRERRIRARQRRWGGSAAIVADDHLIAV